MISYTAARKTNKRKYEYRYAIYQFSFHMSKKEMKHKSMNFNINMFKCLLVTCDQRERYGAVWKEKGSWGGGLGLDMTVKNGFHIRQKFIVLFE